MHVLPLMLALLGCGSTETPAPEPAVEPAPAEAPEAETPSLTPDEVEKVLAVSPLDLEADVREAGIEQSMADLVPATVPEDVYGEVKDRVALQTGALLAYTVLGGRTSDKGVFLTQVRAMRKGMETIGMVDSQLSKLDKAIQHIQNDTASREDFLKELDAYAVNAVPEEGLGPNDTTGPLLQAGAWLAGINIVAQAVVRADDAEAADKLLGRPEVAQYFLKYIQSGEGTAKAGSVSEAVAKGLGELEEISSRETIGVDGAKEAVAVTEKLLKLL